MTPKKSVVAKLLAELLSGLPAALVEMIIPSSFYEGLMGPIRMDESIKMTIAERIMRKANPVSPTVYSEAEHRCACVQAEQLTLMASGGVSPAALPG